MFCLLAILDSAVPRFLSVVSHTEKKWIFSFNEEQCMTEKGKEFQVTDLMHSADLSPTVLLPILGTQKMRVSKAEERRDEATQSGTRSR